MITTKEAAKRTGLTTRRIRQLAESGAVVAEREETTRGPVWMVDEKSLDESRRRAGDHRER